MRKLKKSEQVLLGLLAVVLLVFVWSRSSGGKKQPPATRSVKKAVQTAAAKVGLAEQPDGHKIPAEVRALFKQWGRDPFRGANRLAPPDSSAELDSTQLAWKGTLRTDDGILVMIGPYVLAEGERRGDLQVLKIQRDFVICRYKGKRLTLFRPESTHE